MDSRNLQLAHNLINYSVRLQKGEKLLIELIDEGMELAQALIQEAYKVGGIPFLTIKNLKKLLKHIGKIKSLRFLQVNKKRNYK